MLTCAPISVNTLSAYHLRRARNFLAREVILPFENVDGDLVFLAETVGREWRVKAFPLEVSR